MEVPQSVGGWGRGCALPARPPIIPVLICLWDNRYKEAYNKYWHGFIWSNSVFSFHFDHKWVEITVYISPSNTGLLSLFQSPSDTWLVIFRGLYLDFNTESTWICPASSYIFIILSLVVKLSKVAAYRYYVFIYQVCVCVCVWCQTHTPDIWKKCTHTHIWDASLV